MLKYFKQELLFLPIMLLVLEGFRIAVFHFYPDTAVFDRGSELETFLTRMWQMVWITCGVWVLLRVIFPDVHKAMRRFYTSFAYLPDDKQKDLALKIFFCLFFGLVLLMSGHAQVVTNYEIKGIANKVSVQSQESRTKSQDVRKKLIDTLESQLYVREATGNNDGVEVERYLKFVGLGKGYSWCAAFASWNLNAVGVFTPPNPKSAWAGNFALTKDIVWSPALEKSGKILKQSQNDKQHSHYHPPGLGDCFTLYYSNMGRIGHVGFIVGFSGDYFITIEGNSGSTGSRDGEGVHKYKRAKMKVYAVSSYI